MDTMKTCICAFTRALKQGARTGVYGGPIGQTIATVLFVAALWVGAGLAQGYITVDELAADPLATIQHLAEPTVRPAIDWFTGQNGDTAGLADPVSSSM